MRLFVKLMTVVVLSACCLPHLLSEAGAENAKAPVTKSAGEATKEADTAAQQAPSASRAAREEKAKAEHLQELLDALSAVLKAKHGK